MRELLSWWERLYVIFWNWKRNPIFQLIIHYYLRQIELSWKKHTIYTILNDFDGSDVSVQEKIVTKINFCLERLNRLKPITNDDNKNKSALLVDILSKQTALNKKIKHHNRSLLVSENVFYFGMSQIAISSIANRELLHLIRKLIVILPSVMLDIPLLCLIFK